MSASEGTPSHVERYERPDRRSKTKKKKNEGGAVSPFQPLLDEDEPWSYHEDGIDVIETVDGAPFEEEEAELVDAGDLANDDLAAAADDDDDDHDHGSIDEEIWGDL